jgi:hypothetical protein
MSRVFLLLELLRISDFFFEFLLTSTFVHVIRDNVYICFWYRFIFLLDLYIHFIPLRIPSLRYNNSESANDLVVLHVSDLFHLRCLGEIFT